MKALLKFALVIGLALLGSAAVEAQVTNTTFPQTGYLPYFSPTNVLITGSQAFVANDPVTDIVGTLIGTNNYTYGTNYSGGVINPAGIGSSLNVAFGLTVTTTNAGTKGTYTAYIDGGTGFGDWTPVATLPVNTSLNSLNNNGATPLAGNFSFSTNATVNIGGYKYFRARCVTVAGESNYTSQVTISLSAKSGPGI